MAGTITDTIFALSSGTGKAGVAVVRASGSRVRDGLLSVAGSVPPPRVAIVRTLRAPGAGEPIDRALVLFFAGPASFTGEDVAEFHVHGGRAVVGGLLDCLGAVPGWRMAERGEFTRRAVENGRLDLTEAEGIADLVEAETTAQRRQALRQAGGALEAQAETWRGTILRLLALVEAEIDFPDEGDVPALLGQVRAGAAELHAEIAAALTAGARGERLREGAMIVIAGPPNAGKSTLLNALAKRDVAIVSPIAGTTRDAIEVHLDLDGYPVTLVDTAGLRETTDAVEAMGVARMLERAERADLVLWLATRDADAVPPRLGVPILTVRTKIDRIDLYPQRIRCDVAVSAFSGKGMADLTGRLARAARELMAGAETAVVTRARHRTELADVAAHLAAAVGSAGDKPVELVAEDLRLAVRGIGRLTGRVDIDEIYDLIFRDFCIGK